ncbi:MAG TPA: class I SAM-dependent methyltransferase [Terriglobales bacterium]|nr:class I SAM-dependent methyltransferase [Terriglobales bacterium]
MSVPPVATTSSREAYDTWHLKPDIDIEANTPWHSMLKPLLLNEKLSGKRVLEIGCGRGDFSCWLAINTRAHLTAADFSFSGVTRGKELASSLGLDIDWEVTDMQSIAHSDSSFDYVVSCDTIEHVPDPRRGVSELARVLRPGGKLFLTTPNYLNLMGLYRGYMRLKGTPFTETGQPINHLVMLPRTLRWIRHAGLRVLRHESRGMYLPIPGRPWMLVDKLDHPRVITRWLGLHSMVVAGK